MRREIEVKLGKESDLGNFVGLNSMQNFMKVTTNRDDKFVMRNFRNLSAKK